MFLLYNDFSAKDDWVFFFGRLVAVNYMVNIVTRYSLIGSFDVVSLNSCKCVAKWICVIIDCWWKLFGCFEGNFENAGRMEMFSMPGGSDLMESFLSLACLFDSVTWNEWFTSVSWCDVIYNVENMSNRRNSFCLGPHFCLQNKHIPLKKMIIRTTCKAVNSFSNIARVK